MNPRRSSFAFALLTLASAAALLVALGATGACSKSSAKEVWYCPMHPTYTSDRPGSCPICNMNLVKKEAGAPPAAVAAAATSEPGARRILFYRNPMDPKVTSPVPAKDSMGMDYVPVYADEVSGSSAAPGVDDHAAVEVD